MSTTGNTQNTNINTDNLEKLISYLDNSKKGVSELVKELKELKETQSLYETSFERVNRLQKELNENTKEYNKYLNTGVNRQIIKEYEKFSKESEKALAATEKIKKIEFQLTKIKGNTQEDINKKNKLLKQLQKENDALNDYNHNIDVCKENLKELGSDEIKAAKIANDANKLRSKSLKTNIELEKELKKQQLEGITILDHYNEKWEERSKALKKGINEIKTGSKNIFNAVKETLKPWSEANDEAMKYARNIGMSEKTANKFLSNTLSWAAKNDIGVLFNKSAKELIQMQGKYSEVLGRNVQLTGEQKKDMLAMETFLGEDGMMDIANNLENFGMGMSDSANFIKETMDEATKSGISASKLTKTIRENIKMAQNYSFKNGLDGLTNMAKKSIELKTNMSFINGFIDKTSTVEGAISTGAQLQVLGGNYAMGSDPLSMMYESLNNVEGLFDRAVGMAKGKVFYNNQTGNFEMGAMDRRLMKEAANAMGINSEEMINMAFRKASLDKIEGQIKNSGISGDKEMVEMVKNLATWNNGKAVVNIDGEDVEVGKLNAAEHKDKLEAMQRTDSQNLQEMAINLRSMKDIMSGVQKETETEQANIMKGIGEKLTDFLKNNTGILNAVSMIGAWGNILQNAITGLLGGIWTTVRGIARSVVGTGNLFDFDFGRKGGKGKIKGKGRSLNKIRNVTRTIDGKTYRNIGGGKWQNIKGGKPLSPKSTERLLREGTKNVQWNNPLKNVGQKVGAKFSNGIKGVGTAIKGGGKGVSSVVGKLAGGAGSGALSALGGGVAGAAISLGADIITGELKKDVGGSVGRAAGIAAGTALGTLLTPIMGPLGPMLGGFLGGVVTEGIQKAQRKSRDKTRNEIAISLEKSGFGNLSGFFSGENALQGNYKNRRLKILAEALKDGTLDSNDGLSRGFVKQLKANGDLDRLSASGIDVRYANGGVLNGNPHSNGGMPILGSNVVVEGGEYVVNKEATKNNLPLLEKINNGDYKMTSKEPLGKQMKVNRIGSSDITSSLSKINIEPISINLSGTIKLDTGNKQFDISNEILNNPQLITKLTEMINKQLNILDNGSYNKEKFKQKFA